MRILLTIWMSVCVVLNLSAQEEDVMVLTLEEAQEYAVEHSQDVMLAEIEIHKAKAQVQQAMAALLPQVNATISYTQYGQLPATIFPNDQQTELNQAFSIIEQGFVDAGSPLPVPISQDPSTVPTDAVLQFGERFNVNAEVTASQVVFNGVFLVGLQAAAAFVSIVEHQEEFTVESIKDNIKRSYYGVLAAQANITSIERNITNLTSLRDETQALFDNGFAEGIDVDRLQLSLNNLNKLLDQGKRQIEVSKALLKFQMGMDVYQPIAVVGELRDYMGDINYALSEKGDFSNRTEISFYNVREQVNEYNVKRYKFAYLPSISGYASLGSSAQREGFTFFRFRDEDIWLNQRYFGFQIDIPIWDSFGKKGQVQYAKRDLERIQVEREKVFASMDLEYEQAKSSMISAKEDLDYAQENIRLAEKIYNVSQIKYREGVGSSIEMTNAERDLYQAQTEYIMAVYYLLLAQADVDKALGNY